MYIPFAISFLNFSATRCYKIYNLLWHDAKGKFWDLLHSGAAESLDWLSHDQSEFDDPAVCDFVANVGLYTHAQYAKIASKENASADHLSAKKLQKRIKRAQQRKKIAAFFARFKRKNK